MTLMDTNKEKDRKSYEKVGLIYNALKTDEPRDKLSRPILETLLQGEGNINYPIIESSGRTINVLYAPNKQFSSDERYEYNLLLENGADFTFKDSNGQTVVHEIIYEDEWNVDIPIEFHNSYIDDILNAHVKTNNFQNPFDRNGITHFHAACMTNNASAAEFFLKNGIDVNLAVNRNSPLFSSYTPLHFAVAFTCSDVFDVLLRYGANLHSKNSAGLSPLHFIIKIKTTYEYNENPHTVQHFEKMLTTFVEFCMVSDDDINAADDYGVCKFHAICLHRFPSEIARILDRVVNINQAVKLDSPVCPGYTYLHFAAFSKNIEVVELLSENGANIEANNASKLTPFDLCLQNYSTVKVCSIISKNAEWKNIVLSDKRTKLIEVITKIRYFYEFLSFLDKRKIDPKVSVPFDSPLCAGYTLLHFFVLKNYRITTPYIEVCSKRRAEITVKNVKGLTPLHMAFYMQKLDVVNVMLCHDEKTVDPIDNNNLSHLYIACAVSNKEAVERLLANNAAHVNLPILSTLLHPRGHNSAKRYICIAPGSISLHINAISGNSEITEMLLKHGADVNVQDENGFTPVHRLLSQKPESDGDISLPLLWCKNLKNIITPCGLSHLHVAVKFNHINAVEKLLKQGADVNSRINYKGDVIDVNEEFTSYERAPYDKICNPFAFLSQYSGNTPLHFLGKFGQYRDTALVLLKRNADLFAKNDGGIYPLQESLKDYEECQEFLKVSVGDIKIQKIFLNEYGITKLHVVCCLAADFKAVRKLVEKGANVNAKIMSKSPIWQGWTPLHCAVNRLCCQCEEWCCRTDERTQKLQTIIEFLLKIGADISLTNDNNETPIHLFKSSYEGWEQSFIAIAPTLSMTFEYLNNFNDNPMDNQGLSLFHIACTAFDAVSIEKFLKYNGVDVNQRISFFSRNLPGLSPLHIVIRFYRILKVEWLFELSDETFLQVIDMLLKNSADVNAKDGIGNTPLFEAVKLPTGLREDLIKKLISKGADIHVRNLRYYTAFELLLERGDATLNDINLFLEAGAHFHEYHPKSQQGYFAMFLAHCRPTSSYSVKENPVLIQVINDPKIIEITDSGRTMLHNIVSSVSPLVHTSIEPWSEYGELFSFYELIVEQLLIRGCDIDYQDKEGKTALHIAVDFKSHRAIKELLKHGADINVVDNTGNTAFHYLKNSIKNEMQDGWYCDGAELTANAIFIHAYKLEFCRYSVNEQNKYLQDRNSFDVRRKLNSFHSEIEEAKNINVGSTSLSVYEFLMNSNLYFVYMSMTFEERQEVDEFFENIGKHSFLQIDCLLRLKYRKTFERKKLMEAALAPFNILCKYQLPDLCGRKIIKFLRNEDLKRLIASVS